ncbi:methyl-accepting chemotaxis protein, partial [Thermodesulfatator indicus]
MKLNTIKARVQAIIVIMFVLSILNALVVFVVIQKNHSDALYVNVSGFQRTLCQQIVKDLLSQDFIGAKKKADSFDKHLKAIKNGDPDFGLAPMEDPKVLASWEKLNQAWQKFKSSLDLYLKTKDPNALKYIMDHNLEILSLANDLTNKLEERAVAGLKRLRVYQIIISGISIVMLMIIWWLAKTKIITPIEQAVALVTRISEGDFTVKFPKLTNDEIGRLLSSLKGMTDRLRVTIGSVIESSDRVYNASQEIYRAGEEVAEHTQNLAQEGKAVKEAEEVINKNIKAVSAASDQMVEAITEISKNTSEAAHIANDAVIKAQETNEIVNKLSISSEEIGEVVNLIQSIAE